MTSTHTSSSAHPPPGPSDSLDTHAGFAAVFDRHFDEVHGYIARYLGMSAADDIAAETFLIAYRKRASFDATSGTVRAWLYGIATRQVSRHHRDQARAARAMQRIRVSAVNVDPTDQAIERVVASGLRRQLATALAALPQRDREVLLLVALADLSYAEVAVALAIPPGTVASKLSRARMKLRAELAAQDPTTYREL